MKNIFIIIFGILSLFSTGCRKVAPLAGQEAVLIRRPYFFGSGGVGAESVKPGLKWVMPSTDYYYVTMQPQQFESQFDDLMSADGVPLDFHAVVRLQITDSVSLIRDFGEHWYPNNIGAEFNTRVRQAVRKHGMNETAINTTAIDDIDREVSESMVEYLASAGLPVKLIQVTVGKANPPDSIKNQRINTAAEQQRILTEQQKKLAEDQRKMAEESRAAADNAYRLAMDLSPDQFLALESIKMQYQVCGEHGKGNCTFFVNGDPVPTLPVR